MSALTLAWKLKAKDLRAEVSKLRANAKLSYCGYCGVAGIDKRLALEHYATCTKRPPAEIRLAEHYLGELHPLKRELADAHARIAELEAQIADVRELLPKWAKQADTTKWLLGIEQPWTVCWNDLARALNAEQEAEEILGDRHQAKRLLERAHGQGG